MNSTDKREKLRVIVTEEYGISYYFIQLHLKIN